jgi:hypothetical protein
MNSGSTPPGSLPPGRRAELERLVSTLCDDRLDEADQARLEQLLRDDAECRRFYLEYVDLHARLLHYPRLTTLLDGRSLDSAPACSLPPLADESEEIGSTAGLPDRPTTSRPAGGWWPYVLTAAVTLAATLVVQLATREPTPPPGVNAVAVEQPATGVGGAGPTNIVPEYVATVARTTDCVWDNETDACRSGMRLLPGALRLKSGTAELKFDGGAMLSLVGPAELQVETMNSAAIDIGKVVFRSDDSAEAFDLYTPFAKLVDYGTTYSVVVGPQGEEVHVLDGEVMRTPKADGTGRVAPAQSIAAGHARHFAPCRDCPGKSVPIEPSRMTFATVSKVEPKVDPESELIAYESFDCDVAALPCPNDPGCGRGWKSAWSRCAKADPKCQFTVVGGLWRPTAAARDGAVSCTTRSSLSRRLEQPIRMDRDGVWYFSCLVRSEKRSADGACDLQLVLREQSGSEKAGTNLVNSGKSNSEKVAPEKACSDPPRKLAVTVSWSSSKASLCWEGGGNQASLSVEPGKTYLLAGKIVSGRDAPDQTFVCLFSPRQPVAEDEPTSWTFVSRPVLCRAAYEVVQIVGNTSTPITVDEIRLGRSWRSVAAPYIQTPSDRVVTVD